jgi:hypothetical protein
MFRSASGSVDAPSLRGKNSYHEPYRARRRCTRNGQGPLSVGYSRIGFAAMIDSDDRVVGRGQAIGMREVGVAHRAGGARCSALAEVLSESVWAWGVEKQGTLLEFEIDIDAGRHLDVRAMLPRSPDIAPRTNGERATDPWSRDESKRHQPSRPVPVECMRSTAAIVPSGRVSTTSTPRES